MKTPLFLLVCAFALAWSFPVGLMAQAQQAVPQPPPQASAQPSPAPAPTPEPPVVWFRDELGVLMGTTKNRIGVDQKIAWTPGMTLLSAFAAMGGITDFGSRLRWVHLIRGGRTRVIDWQAAMKKSGKGDGREEAMHLRLLPDDLIVIPNKETVARVAALVAWMQKYPAYFEPETDVAAKKAGRKKPSPPPPKKLTDEEREHIRAAWDKARTAAYDGFRHLESSLPQHDARHDAQRGEPLPTAAEIEKAGRAYNRWMLEDLGETQDEFYRWQRARSCACYPIALAWAREKNWAKAYAALEADVALMHAMGFRFFQRSRYFNGFEEEVFRLHSNLLAAGYTRPIPHAGYAFFILPKKRSIFMWTTWPSPIEADYGSFTVPGLAQNEERHLIYFAKPGKDGAGGLVQHLEVISPRGHFSAKLEQRKDGRRLVLRGMTKVVDFVVRGEDENAYDAPRTYQIIHRGETVPQLALRIGPDSLQTPLSALKEAGGAVVEITEFLRKEDQPQR